MSVCEQTREPAGADCAADSVGGRHNSRKRITVVAVWSTGVAVGAILSSLVGTMLVRRGQGPKALVSTPAKCDTEDCRIATDSLNVWLNTSVDPCQDFYEYVCGRHKEHRRNTMEKMESDLRSWTIAALLATDVPEKNQSAWDKAAGMLQACESVGQTGETEVLELQNWLASLKLDLKNMREGDAFDPIDSLVELSIVHGQPAVLSLLPDRLLILRTSRALTLSVNMDDARWYQFLLETYGRPESISTQFYDEHLRDYGITRTRDREQLSREIATYERKVIAVFKRSKNDEPVLRGAGITTLEEATNGSWAEAVSRHTGGAYGPQSSVVVRPPADRLQRCVLDSAWGARTLLAWSLLRRLLPAALGRPAAYAPSRGLPELCFDRVTEAMQTAVMGRYVESVLKERTMKTTRAVLDGLRAAYNTAFASAAWLKEGDAAGIASRKLSRMRFQVGLPGGMSTAAQLNAVHADKEYSGMRFLPAWLRAVRLEARRLVVDQREPVFDFGLARALYMSGPNILVVPAGLLRPPLLYATGPASHNYGGLGQMAAAEMMRGYDVKGMLLDEQGEKRPWGTTAQRVHLTASAVCLNKWRLDVTGKEIPKFRVRPATDPDFDLLAELSGLQIALTAFRALPSEKRHLSLPSLDPEQAFFVSHCAKWCASPDGPAGSVADAGEIRCIAPLANMEAFSQAFNCSAASRMNRSRKCLLW